MSYLSFQSCVTPHGVGSEKLFHALLNGNPSDLVTKKDDIPFFHIPETSKTVSTLARCQSLLTHQINILQENVTLDSNSNWGLILASTKGITEDIVWNDKPKFNDPYAPLLNWIESQFPVPLKRSICVSNACASSHGAIGLGQKWLSRGIVDFVFIVAIDLIGSFTRQGFKSLRALSENKTVKPFDKNRDGLLLGDGVGCLVLSSTPTAQTHYKIKPVQVLCEGLSATRPDTSGKNLGTCFSQAIEKTPELVIAHGTGTEYNDLTESQAIQLAFADLKPPRVTCTKWSVGHSLGASGALDLCVATEILKSQVAPPIATLEESELDIAELLVSKITEMHIDQILISSLGFGGVCSALQIEKVNQ